LLEFFQRTVDFAAQIADIIPANVTLVLSPSADTSGVGADVKPLGCRVKEAVEGL